MERGLVTTVIAVWNRAGMLRDAVASVLTQDYRPIEILIVDDGSTDLTPQVADELAHQHPEILVIHQANTGPGLARETGRVAARGEFIQHLDSDDLLLPGKFSQQVEGLNANPDAGASYGWTRLRYADGSANPNPYKRTGEPLDAMFPAMLRSRWWDTMSPLYRASLLERAGPWTDLRAEEDWEYDARVASLGTRVHYVADWLCEHRRHRTGQLSDLGMQPSVMRDRARAHELIYQHARRFGIGDDVPEMRHFARELFLLARQCGAADLPQESQRLFELAREASGPRGKSLMFRTYALIARVIGWTRAGKLAEKADRLR
ncbi:MAG TPA: glycosyltransferase family A protein [Thermoanaerobaculia bacterium]|nr:glycosyltransferase family A protein [Thermoanaerobaculia bacterium]